MKIFDEVKRGAGDAIDQHGAWLMGVSAIVADNEDPENQHRVRVIIPSIDENEIYDVWARQMVFCLGNGFGTSFIPPKGSEVVLFGQLGQKHNLFYASLYNEEMTVPATMDSELSVGIHAPAVMKLIATSLLKLQGQNVEVIAAQLAKTTGQSVEAVALQLLKLTAATLDMDATGTVSIDGGTISINSNGAITIHGSGNVNVTAGGTLKLENRTVNKVGPSI